jgi:hypothetical protein
VNLIRNFRALASRDLAHAAAEYGQGTTNWTVRRWEQDAVSFAMRKAGRGKVFEADFAKLHVAPFLVTETAGNLITNAGYQAMLASATGTGTPMFTTAKGRLGVGDTTPTPAYADTDLAAAAGATHRLYKFMAAAPTVGTSTNKTWTFVATFQSGDFNYAWNEFGMDQGTADGNTVTAVFFNHAASAQGTKTTGQVWTATATMTFS